MFIAMVLKRVLEMDGRLENTKKKLKGKIEVEYRERRGLKFFIEKEAIFNLRILGPTLLC